MDTNAPLSSRLARVIKGQFRDAGKSQRYMAAQTGIAKGTLTRRLTGHSPFLVTELGVIAAELDTDVSALFIAAERLAA